MIKLGLFSSSPNNIFSILEPILSFDENVMEAVATADLKHGGDITADYSKFINIVFVCKPNKKEITDVQLVIRRDKTSNFNANEQNNIGAQKEAITLNLFGCDNPGFS